MSFAALLANPLKRNRCKHEPIMQNASHDCRPVVKFSKRQMFGNSSRERSFNNVGRFLLWICLSFILPCVAVEAQNNGIIYQIPTSEYNTLVDLYNSTGGSSWNQNTGWLNPQATSWYGISVSGVQYDTNGNVTVQGNVSAVSLYNNHLTGGIPTSLGNLTKMQQLELNYNPLTGSIPTSFGNLTNMQYLLLDHDQLSGSIPASLGNLTVLKMIVLDDNQFSGSLPGSLGNLVNLQYFYLFNNQFTGSIPTSFGSVNHPLLQQFYLYNNQLSGNIPDIFGGMANLQQFIVDHNQLTGSIPTSLGNLASLNTIYLNDNQLTGGIPTGFGALTQLRQCLFYNNQLSGNIPPSFGNLTNLTHLLLSNNHLTGQVPYIHPSSFGTSVQLDQNCLDISAGSQSLSNITHMIADGTSVSYLPQNTGCSSPPTVTTSAASNVGSLSATLNGTVNPNNSTTTVYFQFGTDITYGNSTAIQNAGSGANTLSFSANLSGLTPNTIYHYRAVAVASGINYYGLDSSFSSFSASQQPYKTDGCQCSIADPSAGNPIRIGTGNKYEEVTDFTTIGVNPLNFTRYYNSQGDTNSAAVALCHNWRSTYDRYLRITGASVTAERADGQELVFTNTGSSWASDSDVDLQLLQSGSSWTLIDSDDSIETYNSAGLLTSIEQRDGYTQTLQYGAGNALASVTDSFGRMLQFNYQSNLLHTVAAPNGLVLTYGYNSSGQTPGVLDRLVSVAYSTTPQTSRSYLYENSSLPFALTGIIDENDNRFGTWTYDSTGRAISSQHANGADLTTIAYNADGSRDVTNALGAVMVYKFTTLQGMPKAAEIDRLATASVPAATMTYTYDSNGYIANISDWNTNLTTQVNDIHDQPLIVNEAVGTAQMRSTTNTYLASFHLPAQIVAPREATTFAYDDYGNMLSRTETDTSTGTVPYSTSGQTRTWTNTYDNFDHLLTATGPRTDVIATTTYTYDASNNLSTVTDPLGHVSRMTNYNGSGLPLTMIDPNGVGTTFTYDARDRLLTRTVLAASGNATNKFGYDAVGQVTRITLPDGSFLNYQYDAAHRLQSVSNSPGESISYTLDALGNITAQNTRNSGGSIVKTQSAVFDQLGRMLQQIGAASQKTTYGYDANGNRVSIQDGLTNTTTQAFDALNRLVAGIDPLTNNTGFGYDVQDNRTSVTDPRSLVTSYVYDGFGRVIQETSPDKGVTVYTLDQAGNRISQTDARGVVTTRTFDKLNRVLTESFPASTGENISFTYDATNGGNFGVGRLTGYTDETGNTTLTYNERGDVISTTRTISGTAYTTGNGYDLADHVTSITYPSGHIITYTRDTQGRISSVAYQPSVSGTVTILATNVTYMPFGPLSGLLYGNGLTRTQIYDQDYRLTGITTLVTGVSIQNLRLAYDAANDITAIADNLDSARSQTFRYDPDYRLTQAIGIYGTTTYSYDADGNRLTRTAANITESYNYSSTANLLQSTVKAGDTRNFGYTANGNVNSDNRGTTTNLTFGYGNRNRYNSLSTGAITASYKFNALGQRLIKTVGTTTTHYHFNGNGQLIAESQASGTLIREYVWLDDMPMAQIENSGTVYFIHPDHLNTPQKMTDANQNIVWDNEQQPFGETALPALTSLGFNASKQFQMTLNGGPNYSYVIQTTTNLSPANWVSLATNTVPFTFTDAGAQNFHARFYRVLYLPNANLVSVTNNLRFSGQYFDAESGLNYNMMRNYDPTMGRYIENDPIGLAGGIDPYVYVANNPFNHVDSFGLDDTLDDLKLKLKHEERFMKITEIMDYESKTELTGDFLENVGKEFATTQIIDQFLGKFIEAQRIGGVIVNEIASRAAGYAPDTLTEEGFDYYNSQLYQTARTENTQYEKMLQASAKRENDIKERIALLRAKSSAVDYGVCSKSAPDGTDAWGKARPVGAPPHISAFGP